MNLGIWKYAIREITLFAITLAALLLVAIAIAPHNLLAQAKTATSNFLPERSKIHKLILLHYQWVDERLNEKVANNY